MKIFKGLTVYLSIIFGCWLKVGAAIPQAAKDDPRYALGYLVVTHYQGVNPDGTGDSHPGIQQAIDDAHENDLVVFFPPGTYLVSDVLKCYQWVFWNPAKNAPHNTGKRAHILIGSNQGVSRPVIQLAANATGFDNPLIPRPVIVWRMFTAINENGISSVEPENPLTGVPPNFRSQPNIIMGWHVRNIDLDLNNNSGAIGGGFAAAQYCGVADMRINATGAYAGIFGVPGRNSFISNLEIEGGRIGVSQEGNSAGSVLVGARLFNQTESPIVTDDFCPYSIVGFHIVTSAPQAILTKDQYWASSANSTYTLVDGKIEMTNGGTALDNPLGKDIHVSNVYIKGAENLVKSATQSPLTGSDDWRRIVEYTFNNQNGPAGDNIFNSFSAINGKISQTPEPLTRVEMAEPPANLLERHLMDGLPGWEGQNDGTINVKSPPYSAKGDGISDDWAAIQDAIDASSTGRVFLPKGNYVISKTLTLKPNTQLIGLDQNYSVLVSSPTWVGGQSRYMVESANDQDATSFLGFIGLDDQAATASSTTGGFIHWKAGKNSTIIMVRTTKEWGSYYGKYPRYDFHFSANAGGRHMICPHYPPAGDHVGGRMVFIEGTNQPLTFYGLNVESHKPTSSLPTMAVINSNIEILNSSNIRIHSIKREGNSSTLVIRNSQNIGVYGLGRQIQVVKPEWEGEISYIHILGTSNNVVIATHTLDNNKKTTESFLMLHESITGQSSVRIEWPNNVSLYKRGELSDIYADYSTSSKNISTEHTNFSEFTLYPNPFSEKINLDFTIPSSRMVNITVLDIQNRLVKVLANQMMYEGEHNLKWDGRDQQGNPLKHGMYFMRMMAGNIMRTEKIMHIN